MTVRVGVLGAGVMGADHVRTLGTSVGGATVTAVADLDVGRAKAAAEQVEQASPAWVSNDPHEVIAAEDVDAVVVASADLTHEEFVLACLAAGKPVLCEKPLTPNVEGGRKIVDAEVALGRRLVSVGFMRRYDPGFVELRSAAMDGSVGEPLMLHCVHRNARSRPDAPTANLITGTAVHEIDVLRWLFGEEPVTAQVHWPRPSSLVVGRPADPLLLVMGTASGRLVDVEVFVNAQYGYDVRCELVGETGAMSLDYPAPTSARGARRVSLPIAEDWRDRFADAYRLQLRDWVAGIVAGEQRGASAWDGYAATVVADYCVRALGSSEPVSITVPPAPPLYQV